MSIKNFPIKFWRRRRESKKELILRKLIETNNYIGRSSIMWRANINRVNQKQQRQRSHHHHHHDADKNNNNNNNNNNLSSEELKLKRIEVAISAATVGHFRTLKNSSDIRSKGNLSLCYGKMGSSTVSTKHISHIDRSDDDTLWSLIRKFDWDSIDSCLNVESCKFKNSKGSTPLHLICSM